MPSYFLFVCIFVVGLLGFWYPLAARFFLFCNIAYAFLNVFYLQIISLCIINFPHVQPKPIGMLVLTIALSVLAAIILNIPGKINKNRLAIYSVLSLILIWQFLVLSNKFVYELHLLLTSLFVLSLVIIEVFSNFSFYNYKKYHLIIAFLFFVSLSLVNFVPLDCSIKTIGVVKGQSVWALDEPSYDKSNWTLQANYSYSVFMKVLASKYDVITIKTDHDWQERITKCNAVLFLTGTVNFYV